MCGIVGIIGQHSIESLESIRNSIHHRGPDDSGLYSDQNVLLLHSRLSIQDLSSNGHQPMISEDGNYIIVFNGEIYNHWDIRSKLNSKYSFRSTSDTETLLYGFIEYGKDLLDQLKGIFAFAVYNKKSGDLFIARDQFGVKPLYYYSVNNSFLFGSEIKSLLQFPGFDRSISHSTLLDYITFLYSPSENTAFEKVKKLLPGHYMELNIHHPSSFTISNYFEISFHNSYEGKSEKELIDDLETLLFSAIERQMISDVPIGYFLSGGLDSSLLLTLTKHIYPDRVFPCFSISNNLRSYEGFNDDFHYAKIAAKQLHVDLHPVPSHPLTVELFDKIIYHLDEPITDPASQHVMAIAEEARKQGIKVLQSGTGADELFSGYRRHQALGLEKLFNYSPSYLLKTIYKISSLFPSSIPAIRRFQKLFQYSELSPNDRFAFYHSWIDPEIVKELFSNKLKKDVMDYNPLNLLKAIAQELPENVEGLNKVLYMDIKSYLVHNNLTYTDKMSMAHGVEVRVPYLDKEIAKFSFHIPASLKMKGVTTKYLLRKLAEKYVPQEIIKREKTGFGSPIRTWMKNDTNELVNRFLKNIKSDSDRLFDPQKVEQLIEKNKKGKIDASYSILSLIAIDSWKKQFVDSN